jgi:hypothetical protein
MCDILANQKGCDNVRKTHLHFQLPRRRPRSLCIMLLLLLLLLLLRLHCP